MGHYAEGLRSALHRYNDAWATLGRGARESSGDAFALVIWKASCKTTTATSSRMIGGLSAACNSPSPMKAAMLALFAIVTSALGDETDAERFKRRVSESLGRAYVAYPDSN